MINFINRFDRIDDAPTDHTINCHFGIVLGDTLTWIGIDDLLG